MRSTPFLPLFRMGRLTATPGALAAIERAAEVPGTFFCRHVMGDWGELTEEDRAANADALEHDLRILSAYQTKMGERLWVITEADRSVTTILLPEEY